MSDDSPLLDAAAAAIAERLFGSAPPDLDAAPAALRAPGASFVTLERGGRLLGCIGTIEPSRPLIEDVAVNATQSAFADPRLPAVTVEDYAAMSIKVSVLSPLEEMPGHTQEQVLGWLRPGTDGILIAAAGRRATFLPSVWEMLREPDAFLARLLEKAGLSSSRWPDGATVWRYTTTELVDPGPRPLPQDATDAAQR